MTNNLHELLISSGLDRIADVIERHARPSIRLTAHAVQDEGMLALGTSKLGGSPDLPLNFTWPQNDGFSLSFVAQINLADIAPYDPSSFLPHEGLLSFFFDKDYNFRVWYKEVGDTVLRRDDPNLSHVSYWEGETAQLRRTPMPERLPLHPEEQTGPYPPCLLRASADISLPFSSVLYADVGNLTEGEEDAYWALQKRLRTFGDQTTLPCTDVNPFAQMFGHQNVIQRPTMRVDDILLFQVDSFYTFYEEKVFGDIEWGDSGIISYIIDAMSLVVWRDFRHVRIENQYA